MQTKGTFSEQEPEVADPNGLYVNLRPKIV